MAVIILVQDLIHINPSFPAGVRHRIDAKIQIVREVFKVDQREPI